MRLRQLLLAALLLASCNSILGNADYHLVAASAGTDSGGADPGPQKCQRNSDCALDEVCLFATCGQQCNADRDCAMGSRCLKTDTGVACVLSVAATCAAGCPAGSVCSPTDGVCRNTCTTECLTGQTCTDRLCVGTDEHEAESGSGGSGGGGRSGTTGGSDGGTDAGAGGMAEPDPCAGVTCNVQQAAECKSVGTKTSYAAKGTCSEGNCSYAPTDTDCLANQSCGGAGVCSVCKDDASCGATCAACGGATKKCKDLGTTSNCVACLSNTDCGVAKPNCNSATNVCEAPLPPSSSCVGLAKTCGPAGTADCCASSVVTGGTFNRGNNAAYPATVADFRLDNYEITVGRFRQFVAVYSQTMTASGAGKNPNNVNDTGWDTAWNTSLKADAVALQAALKCAATFPTWTNAAGTAATESLPINCISWFDAQAFCIWDGGRLPTEAEWNYAAAGGTAQRIYPWGATAPDCSYANFYDTDYCALPGTGAVNRVGSESTTGDGLYGQSDLAGNVWEWTQDGYASAYAKPCDNCARLAASALRVIRGGGFHGNASFVLSSYRGNAAPSDRGYSTGARCARGPGPG